MLTTQARLATDAWRKSAIAGSNILTPVVFTATTNSAVQTAASVPHFLPAAGRPVRDCADAGGTFTKEPASVRQGMGTCRSCRTSRRLIGPPARGHARAGSG